MKVADGNPQVEAYCIRPSTNTYSALHSAAGCQWQPFSAHVKLSIERLNYASIVIVIHTRFPSHPPNYKYIGEWGQSPKFQLTYCVEEAISLQITTSNQRLRSED